MRLRLLTAVVIGASIFGASAASAMQVLVSISKVTQKMTVSVDDEKKYVWLVSTGGVGYDTPSGTFHPFRMEKDYFSKEWDNAPMPNAMFFTPRGHAIHGSYKVKSLGKRASHGCVRLAPENAAKLYDLVQKAGMRNTTIVIKGGFFDGGGLFSSDDLQLNKKDKAARKGKKPFWWLAAQ